MVLPDNKYPNRIARIIASGCKGRQTLIETIKELTITKACSHYRINEDEIYTSLKKEYVLARQVCYYVLKQLFKENISERKIAKMFRKSNNVVNQSLKEIDYYVKHKMYEQSILAVNLLKEVSIIIEEINHARRNG